MTAAAVRDEMRAMKATIGRGRRALTQMGLGYPGGDSCPAMVIRGLAKLRCELGMGDPEGEYRDPEETAALQWIDHWLDPGKDMLPRDEK